MSRENYIVEKIDRKREASVSKAARTARSMYLRMSARRIIKAALDDLPDPADRAALLGDLIDIAAEHRWPLIGRVETATGLNKVAADVCAIFRLDRATKNAAAEHAFARITAANDGGEE